MHHNNPNSTTHFRDGLSAAWPICLGYFPIGLSLGVLAQKAGLAPWQVTMMSVLVFAGGSQFIAVAMLQSGATMAEIIFTTFMVNLRHTLMTSSLAVYLPRVNRWFLALFAYGVTDESYAVAISRFRRDEWDRWRSLVTNQTANLAWIISTTAGVYIGQFIPAGAFGMNYALTAMFLCLLSFQIHGLVYVLTTIVAAILAVLLYLVLPGNAYVIIASCLAATVGFFIKRYLRRISRVTT